MLWFEVSESGEKQFVHLTEVKRSVFERMVEVVAGAQQAFGHPRKR